jgi:VWFA-related protein
MKSPKRKLTFIAVFILFISSETYAQKEQIYKFKAEVNLINLQVTVVDKDGNFVEGLKAEDFIILDKGKQQKISHFDYVVHDEFHVDLIKRGSPAYRRHFFLLFDLTFATAKGIVNARKAALDFIENQILPTDFIAVGTFSAYQGFKALVNFTNDKNQLKKVIASLGLVKAGHLISDPNGYNFESLLDALEPDVQAGMQLTEVQSEANEILAEMLTSLKKIDAQTYKINVSNFIKELHTLGEALNLIKGKKNIIYFSEGFDGKVLTGSSLKELDKDTDAFIRGQIHAIDSEKRFGDAGIRLRMEKMLQEFVASDCIIQTIDIGGLRVEKAAGRFDETQTGQSTLFLMSNNTGGVLYKNMNDLNKALDDILQTTSKYYVIGYYAEDIDKEGKFRKIKVKVNRPDLKIITRKGYYEDKPYKDYTPFEKSIQLAEYITQDITQDDIQFEALAEVFPGEQIIYRIPIFLQFPGQQFLDKKGKKAAKLEIYSYLIDSYGHFKDFFFSNVAIDIKKSKKRLQSHGLKYFDMLLTTSGKHKLKLIVRDSETGEIGSKICSVDVPDFMHKELAVTSPLFMDNDTDWLLSRGYDPNKPEGRRQGLPVNYPFTIENQEFIPAVLPELRLNQPAQFCFKVYNLMLHPEAKIPQTTMNFEIIDLQGNTEKLQKISLISRPTQGKDDCFELFFQCIIEGKPPGEYQFKVTITDNLAKKQAESSIPFILRN